MATLIVGRDYLRSRAGRAALVLVALLWMAGSLTVDLLWWTEGTERGVGPVWGVPLVSPTLAAFGYLFIFVGGLLEMCLYFPEAIFKTGSTIQTTWLLVFAVLLACCLRWLTRTRAWLTSLALAASVIFLGWKAVEWSSFIAD